MPIFASISNFLSSEPYLHISVKSYPFHAYHDLAPTTAKGQNYQYATSGPTTMFNGQIYG